MTATESKKSKIEKPEPPKHSYWRQRTLSGLKALLNPYDYLTIPSSNTPIKEYLEVRKIFSPNISLLSEIGNINHLVGFPSKTATGEKLETQVLYDPTVTAEHIAAECACKPNTDDRKVQFIAVLTNLLHRIDEEISGKISQPHPGIIAPADFGKEYRCQGLVGFDDVFVIGRARSLPENHPLHTLIPEDWRFLSSWNSVNEVTYVLGFADIGALPSVPVARRFYRMETAVLWSLRAIFTKLRLERDKSNMTFQEALDVINKGDDYRQRLVMPSVNVPQPNDILSTVNPPLSWSARIEKYLEVARSPAQYFIFPNDTESLQDLLDVRLALGTIDNDKQPLKYAADRLAALVSGTSRYSMLVDALAPIISSVSLTLRNRLNMSLEKLLISEDS